MVSFILGESFNYWAIAEGGYQQQLFLQLYFKLRMKHGEFHGKKQKSLPVMKGGKEISLLPSVTCQKSYSGSAERGTESKSAS